MADINWKNKCWVTTIYLVRDKKVLLTWNKNLQTWIPVGGHIDPGETPLEAITREVAEETGFDFEIVQPSTPQGTVTILHPHRIQLEKVPHHNNHINFIFIGKCTSTHDKTHTDEEEQLRWFSKEELEQEDMLENVKIVALEALTQYM